MRDVIIGTAGHIDHGKTTLVKALTGIDTDRLEEEQRRGITIDIGFAHSQWDDLRLGFIDVPGHEKFVKNMLSGIGGIDLVLLVVAADESIMPQTIEHFQICRLLDIDRGVIVITKKNKVDAELLELVEEEIRDLTRGTFLAQAPAVPVDSLSGEGLDQLRQTILESIADSSAENQNATRHFRFPVDRVFSIRGFGTVVTGTPYSGQVQVDQPLRAYPGDKVAKVRGMQIFGAKSQQAFAGQRTALNLSGLNTEDLERGTLLAPPDAFRPSHILDVDLHLLEDAPAPLKHRDPIRFHFGSAELLGRVALLEGRELAPGGSMTAQLRLDTPAVCCLGDRFILRRYSPMRTIGGGTILDPTPRKHRGKQAAAAVKMLSPIRRSLAEKDSASARRLYFKAVVERAGPAGVTIRDLASGVGFRPEAVRQEFDAIKGVQLIGQEPLLVSTACLQSLEAELLRFLDAFHADQPLAAGAPSEELRKRFFARAPVSVFQTVLDSLLSRGAVRVEGGKVGLAGREVKLDDSQAAIRKDLLARIEADGFNAPSLAEIQSDLAFPSHQVQQMYYHLLERGELVRMTENVALTSPVLAALLEKLQERFPVGQPFSVADFKNLLGISRKYAIPYLEYLDRNRITQRLGDQRVLKAISSSQGG